LRKNTKLNLIGNFFFRCSVKKTDKWELDGILKTRGSLEPVLLTWACVAHPSMHRSPEPVSPTQACIAHPSMYHSPKPVSLTQACITHLSLYRSLKTVLLIWLFMNSLCSRKMKFLRKISCHITYRNNTLDHDTIHIQ
jgi:hypothetical protein